MEIKIEKNSPPKPQGGRPQEELFEVICQIDMGENAFIKFDTAGDLIKFRNKFGSIKKQIKGVHPERAYISRSYINELAIRVWRIL